MGLFVIPAVLEAGPGGGAVMAGVLRRKFPIVMTLACLVAVLTGLRLYMIRWSAAWATSAEGMALGVLALESREEAAARAAGAARLA